MAAETCSFLSRRPGACLRIGLWATLLAGAPAGAADVEVEITGVGDAIARNVRAYLSIASLAETLDAASSSDEGRAEDGEAGTGQATLERRVRRAHSSSRAEIEAALRPFGYYEPRVEASLNRDDETWVARYVIEPGEPTRIDEVDVVVVGEGSDTAAVSRAREILESLAGTILRHTAYESAKSRLFDSAYNAGYIDASFTRSELVVRPEAREADVHLRLDTGARYYFGEIVIEQDILDEAFLDGFVEIEEGDPFDPDRLIDLQLALDDSGYFDSVNIEARRAQAVDRRIPIVATTTPRRNQSFTVGAGYGTDTGPRFRFGVELRRLNRKGHRFTADLRTSARENSVAGEYRVPVGDLTTDYISYRGSLGREEIGDFDTQRALLGAGWNDIWNGLQRRFYIEARREDFGVEDIDEQSEDVLYAGVSLSGKETDDPLFTRRGYSWSVDLRGGAERLAGSVSFARLSVDGNYIRPLGERGRLLLRGKYGAIRTAEFDRLIPSQRFFAGGDGSVRGYELESLAPTGIDDAVTGGRYLASASIEMDYLFFGDFGGAVFYDVGNAANEPTPELKRGAGIGLRWRSPVGMVSVDFAHPFDDPDEDFRLHLSIGGGL